MATILIVDDNVEACKPLAMLFSHLGHRGHCVGSGEESLQYVRQHKPDLMILDMMMPGMDGLEVLRILRGDPETASIPVIMFSAISDPAFRQHALSKGANDYWVKASLDYGQIQDLLARYLPLQ